MYEARAAVSLECSKIPDLCALSVLVFATEIADTKPSPIKWEGEEIHLIPARDVWDPPA